MMKRETEGGRGRGWKRDGGEGGREVREQIR